MIGASVFERKCIQIMIYSQSIKKSIGNLKVVKKCIIIMKGILTFVTLCPKPIYYIMDIYIKEVVKAHNMTLQDVSSKIGYKSLPSFYRQINNPETLSMKTLIKVAAAIGCQVNDFFREPPKPNNSLTCPYCGRPIYLHPSISESPTEAK